MTTGLTAAQQQTLEAFRASSDCESACADTEYIGPQGDVVLVATFLTFGEREQYCYTLMPDGTTRIW